MRLQQNFFVDVYRREDASIYIHIYIYILGALSLEQRVLRLCVRCVVWRARCPKVQRDCEGITDAHLSRSEGSTQHHRRHPASAVTATKNQRKTRSGILSRPPWAAQNRAQNAQKINPGRILEDLGRSGEVRGRLGSAPGRSRGAPGRSQGTPWTPPRHCLAARARYRGVSENPRGAFGRVFRQVWTQTRFFDDFCSMFR